MDPRVERVVEKAKRDKAILAVMIFGSRARGEGTPHSDVDLCLVLPQGKDSQTDQTAVHMEYLADQAEGLDLRIYQQLPLYIRRRVLREGVILFCRDLDALYELAYRTAQAFEDFKPIYRHYLEQVAHAGS